jgi:hypothetical protein
MDFRHAYFYTDLGILLNILAGGIATYELIRDYRKSKHLREMRDVE